MPKTIILTGASRGIGRAIAQKLLGSEENHNLVLVARTEEPMLELKEQFPERVEVVVGDLSGFEIGAQTITKALSRFSSIHALILNHGVLSPVKPIAESNPEEWRELFNITPSIPHLRATNGTIVLTSSGASTTAYATWGAYGSSKAALNHLASTLCTEEPLITTLAIKPGVVDTTMQTEVRTHCTNGTMSSKDATRFLGLKTEGKLLKPEQPANVMALVAVADFEGLKQKGLSGRFLSWDDKLLSEYQE